MAIVGVGVVIFMILFSFVGPLIYHTQQVFANPNISLDAPNAAHPLGTDALGYDNLGRLMLGGQTSLEVGLAAALIAVTVGAVWGAVAGLVGGFVDAMAKQQNKSKAEIEKEFFKNVRPSSLLKRFATVDEVAAMATYVASELSSATNGAALRVDGGVVRAIL